MNKGAALAPAPTLTLIDALNLAYRLDDKAEACATRSELATAIQQETAGRREDEASAIERHMLHAWLRTPQGRQDAIQIIESRRATKGIR